MISVSKHGATPYLSQNAPNSSDGQGINFPDIYKSGKPKATLQNFYALLEHHGINIFYDEIKKDISVLLQGDNPYSVDNCREASLGVLTSVMEQEGMPVRHIEQYICETADKNRINPVKNWILSKHWDGVDRFAVLSGTIITETWFPTELKELFVRKWLISAVAAACHDPRTAPFSSRGVLVLAGKQGIGKTRWFRRLAPQRWVCDGVVLDPANKDSVMGSISFWLVELGELDSTFRRDVGRLKAFLTREQDQLRPPYARRTSQFPRRTVFCASVNEPEFLVDRTGNDRFWTLPVLSVKHDHEVDMQQVFSQAYMKWANGAEWWLTQQESRELAASNERFEEKDEIYDLLVSCINWADLDKALESNLVEWMNPTEVLVKRCGFTSKPSKSQTNSCAAHLRKLTGSGGKWVWHKGKAFPVPLGKSYDYGLS